VAVAAFDVGDQVGAAGAVEVGRDGVGGVVADDRDGAAGGLAGGEEVGGAGGGLGCGGGVDLGGAESGFDGAGKVGGDLGGLAEKVVRVAAEAWELDELAGDPLAQLGGDGGRGVAGEDAAYRAVEVEQGRGGRRRRCMPGRRSRAAPTPSGRGGGPAGRRRQPRS
jgi:hypothetical protein